MLECHFNLLQFNHAVGNKRKISFNESQYFCIKKLGLPRFFQITLSAHEYCQKNKDSKNFLYSGKTSV